MAFKVTCLLSLVALVLLSREILAVSMKLQSETSVFLEKEKLLLSDFFRMGRSINIPDKLKEINFLVSQEHILIKDFLKKIKLAAFHHKTVEPNRAYTKAPGPHGLTCPNTPSVSVLKFLGRICEDCYSLYRDFDVFEMCRSDCFTSQYFSGCMNVMLVSKSTRTKAAAMVSKLNLARRM